MQEVMTWTFLLLIGHFITDLSFYSVHRWILHGWLGNFKLLVPLIEQHRRHHASPLEIGGLLFTPFVNTIMLLLGALFLYFSSPFGLGYVSYIFLYSWRHGRSHLGLRDGMSIHHMVHHLVSPKFNFDIVYPVTDIILGTYLEANGSIKKFRDDSLKDDEDT